MSDPTLCPHCAKPLGFEIVASVKNESKVKFSVSPAPGEMMTAKNVGGAIAAMGDLMKAIARSQKIPTEVLVEKIVTDDSGTITTHLLIARWDHPHAEAARKRRIKRKEPT